MKKGLILLAITIFIANFSLAQKQTESALQKYSRVKFKVETIRDRVVGVNENYSLINVTGMLSELKNSPMEKSWPISVTYTYTGCSTIYDYISNATPQNIIQDPNNANRIHLVCMSSPWGDPYPNFPGRRNKYYYSTNKGTSWTFVSDVPSGIRGGFPSITLAPNGNALLSGNIGSGNNENVRWYYDAAPGLGSFTELFPALNQRYLFPRTVSSNSLTNPNKFISIVSSYDLDSAFWINCTMLSPSPGTFGPPNFLNAKPAECYFIARGDDGRIGIVYIANNLLQPVDIGDVYFVETTNHGNSFSSPTKIFDANISPSGDSLGAFRGISMVYQVNVPKVVFETVKQTSSGYYFPGAPAEIRFWSTSLPGIDPNRSIVIVDTSNTGYCPYISKGLNNDLFASMCRPTIGKNSSGNFLHLAFMVPLNRVGGIIDTNSYMSIWYSYSVNSGLNWSTHQRISPVDTNNMKDWTYPSLSITNDNGNPYYYYFNFSCLSDSISGSYINHPLNSPSYAKIFFARGHNVFEPPPPPPDIPVLNLPYNGATNVILSPLLDWFDANCATDYHVQVSLFQAFNSLVIDTGVNISEYSVPNGKFIVNTTYYWRVRSYNNYTGMYSAWSTVWYFTTRSTSVNTISSEIPKEYKLYQNYPNPFNPTTIIRFQIKDSRHGGSSTNVKLIVYDILGKEVATLVNEKLNAGYYETTFDGSKLSSGVYIYKLTAGDFIETKKSVILK